MGGIWQQLFLNKRAINIRCRTIHPITNKMSKIKN